MLRFAADKADFLKMDPLRRHSEALDFLDPIIAALQTDENLKQLMIEKNGDGRSTCDIIIATLEKKNFGDENEAEKYYKHVKQVIKKAKNCNLDLAVALCHALVYLIRFFSEGVKKLEKFKEVGFDMSGIVETADEQNKNLTFQPCMENLLHEMQSISDVDLHVKLEKIAWCLQYYGYCYLCSDVSIRGQAADYHKQGICLMKSAYGEEAKLYKVFGICLNNLASSCYHSERYIDAHNLIRKALVAYEHAEDYKDNKEKRRLRNNAAHLLGLTCTKLNWW